METSLERGLTLLKAVIRDGGASSLSTIARQEGVPVASAQPSFSGYRNKSWALITFFASVKAAST